MAEGVGFEPGLQEAAANRFDDVLFSKHINASILDVSEKFN